MTDNTLVRRRVRMTVLILLAAPVAGEIASRIWVASKYTPERIEQLTTHAPRRGRFASHPYLPFALNPAFPGHNALGFRGGAFEARKPPGTRRILCVGASTTYGSLTDPDDSYPAELGKLMSGVPGGWQVINAGVPGWVSTEMLVDLEIRVLPLEPDVVVILLPRNEIFPQAFNGFRLDYTHFRRPGYNFTVSNFAHKEIFRWSRLALLACTVRGDRFGWSETAEHPLYGGMVWENRPTVDEAVRNIRDPACMATLRLNLESMIQLCLGRGIRVLVCTMPIRPDLLALDELDRDPRLNAELVGLIERDNDLGREIARRMGAQVVETARLQGNPDLFVDDSHLTAEGHRQEARLVYDALTAGAEAR